MKHWTEEEINLIKNNAKLGISYKESANQIGRSEKSVQLKMLKLGFIFTDFYTKPIKHCKQCNKELKNYQISFCNQSCSASFSNKIRKSKKEDKLCKWCKKSMRGKQGKIFCSRLCHKKYENKKLIDEWLNGGIGYVGENKTLKKHIRNYLIKKADNKCSKCSWMEIHPTTGKVPLEINHINGDACDCRPENLEVLCPNCHSLTPNFRALNKNSSRNRK